MNDFNKGTKQFSWKPKPRSSTGGRLHLEKIVSWEGGVPPGENHVNPGSSWKPVYLRSNHKAAAIEDLEAVRENYFSKGFNLIKKGISTLTSLFKKDYTSGNPECASKPFDDEAFSDSVKSLQEIIQTERRDETKTNPISGEPYITFDSIDLAKHSTDHHEGITVDMLSRDYFTKKGAKKETQSRYSLTSTLSSIKEKISYMRGPSFREVFKYSANFLSAGEKADEKTIETLYSVMEKQVENLAASGQMKWQKGAEEHITNLETKYDALRDMLNYPNKNESQISQQLHGIETHLKHAYVLLPQRERKVELRQAA